MFSDKDAKITDRIETLIGEQCSIVGNLSGGGLLRVDGSIDGDILWQDDVVLGVLSIYNGNLSCKNAIISGKLKGTVICEGTLTIDNSGKVTGDITVGRLIVKEGGSLDGKCTMVTAKDATEVLEY